MEVVFLNAKKQQEARRVFVCVWVPRGACCLTAPMGVVSSTGLGATGLCVVE